MHERVWLGLLVLAAMATGCGEPLPDEVTGYQERCIKMNPTPHEPTEDDPHEGYKDVYACNIDAEALAALFQNPPVVYPDGTLIVKNSTKEGQDWPWLVATMKKVGGTWQWAEYTRNFRDEEFRTFGVSDTVCIDCHAKVKVNDFVYQVYVQ